jgi:hypothetical protein
MEWIEALILTPFWMLIMFILWGVIATAFLVFFLILARGPASKFIKARVNNMIPIIFRYSTGEVGIRLTKRFPEYIELAEYSPAFLPAFKQSETGKPDYWESIKKPVYIVDERKAVALTFDDVAFFTELANKEPKNKTKEQEIEYDLYDKILKIITKRKEIVFHKFEMIKIDKIQKYIDERWNISAPRAYGRRYEERGEKKAGFSMGRFAIPFGLLAGAGILIFIIYFIAKSQGWM